MTEPRQHKWHRFPHAFWIAPLAHLAAALPFVVLLNIWSDEASTLWATRHGLAEAFTASLNEKQAPFYFIFLSAWRLINDSQVFARIPSLIFALAAIAVFYKLAKRFLDERTAVVSTFFFALHPFLFYTTFEIRVYSLVILFTAVLGVLFFEAYLDSERISSTKSLLVIAVTLLALLTNYYIGFLLVGFAAGLLATRRYGAFWKFVRDMAIVGVLFTPMVYVVVMQLGQATAGYVDPRSLGEGLRALWNRFLTFTLPTEIYTPEEISSWSFVRLWLVRLAVPLAAITLIWNRRWKDDAIVLLTAVSGVGFVLLLVAYFILGPIYVEIRHSAFLFVPMMLLLATVARRIVPRGSVRRPLLAAGGVLLIGFYSYGFSMLYPAGVKRGDWSRVANYVEQNEKPGQPILVFRSYETIAFRLNYSGANEVFPKRGYFTWEYEAPFGSPDIWTNQIKDVTSRIPTQASEVWLLTESTCQETESCRPLEKWVEANYTVLKTKDFYKERVRLLRRR
ncbi:MAG: glycosyltransferase family 39 protein [Pyrinomonadaceae bacterium]